MRFKRRVSDRRRINTVEVRKQRVDLKHKEVAWFVSLVDVDMNVCVCGGCRKKETQMSFRIQRPPDSFWIKERGHVGQKVLESRCEVRTTLFEAQVVRAGGGLLLLGEFRTSGQSDQLTASGRRFSH